MTGGLILCGQRYYDPGAGRWLTRDPLGMGGGVNLYGYKIQGNGNYAGGLASMVNFDRNSAVLSAFGNLSYNDNLALGGLTATDNTGTGLSANVSYGYTTHPVGNPYVLLSETNRLGASYSHGYDAGLNPTSLRGVPQPACRQDDVPTGSGAPAFDADGNYNAGGVVHDAESRMVKGPSNVNFRAGFRADGLRAFKEANGVRTFFLYDAAGDPAVEMDPNGNPTAINAYDPEGLVARVNVATGAATYYQFDPQGNVSHSLNANGAVIDTRAYDAFGKELATRAPGNSTVVTSPMTAQATRGAQAANAVSSGSWTATTPTDPFGFNARWGYYYDREIGAYYCENREYDPGTPRWLERAPLGFAGGMNQYSYCAADPVGRMDPTGLMYPAPESTPGLPELTPAHDDGFTGYDMPGPDGIPARVGGWTSWLNQHGNIETCNGTMHVHDWQDYHDFMNTRHWQLHEEGHIHQNFSTRQVPLYALAWLAGIAQEFVTCTGSPSGTSGNPYGHDYNIYETYAEDYARQRDGQWQFGSSPHTSTRPWEEWAPGMPWVANAK